MDRITVGIAEAIHAFKFDTDPKDLSPPHQTPEMMAVRNLTIIDLTNKIAHAVANGDEVLKEAFLGHALRSRTE